jgi:hypothetical protein
MICLKCGMEIPGRSICPYCKSDLSGQKTTEAIIQVAGSFISVVKFSLIFIVNFFVNYSKFFDWLHSLGESDKYRKMSVRERFKYMNENWKDRNIP